MNFTFINLFTLFWNNNDSNNNNNNDNDNNNNNNTNNILNNQQSTSTAYYQRRSLVQGWWFASVQGSTLFDGIVCDGGARRPALLSSTTGMHRSWLMVLINLLCYFFLYFFIFFLTKDKSRFMNFVRESRFIPKVGINGLLIMIPSFILWSKHCQLFHFWIPILQSGMWTHHKCFRKINIHNKC